MVLSLKQVHVRLPRYMPKLKVEHQRKSRPDVGKQKSIVRRVRQHRQDEGVRKKEDIDCLKQRTRHLLEEAECLHVSYKSPLRRMKGRKLRVDKV